VGGGWKSVPGVKMSVRKLELAASIDQGRQLSCGPDEFPLTKEESFRINKEFNY
jgi:hypothetical protein